MLLLRRLPDADDFWVWLLPLRYCELALLETLLTTAVDYNPLPIASLFATGIVMKVSCAFSLSLTTTPVPLTVYLAFPVLCWSPPNAAVPFEILPVPER